MKKRLSKWQLESFNESYELKINYRIPLLKNLIQKINYLDE